MLKKLFITFTFFILITGCSGGDKSPVDSGLEDGGLFSHDGFVKIPLVDRPHVRGSGGTGNVGSVTVVTT